MSAATLTRLTTQRQWVTPQWRGDGRNAGFVQELCKLTGSTYETGGVTWDLSNICDLSVVSVFFTPLGVADAIPIYVPATGGAPATGKVKFMVASTGLEVANGVDLSSMNWHAIVIGF